METHGEEIIKYRDLEDLKAKLKLQETPEVIECFDISHLSGTSVVGSMVQFRNGLPDKSNYRRFKIRTVEGVDDTTAIAEVVRRRYTRLITEKSELPNLIVVDGGQGQLNAGIKEHNKLGLRIPIIAIAKKFEEIYLPGLHTPLKLSKKTKALQLIQQIRDEAHRFAIGYHKKLREKRILQSPLEATPGIGKKRRFELLRVFGSIEGIRNASLDEIAQLKGFNKKLAERLLTSLRRST